VLIGQNWRYFQCPVSKTKSWWKRKPTWKLKHANCILETFEYFCQISSKSITIILSYTVSKLVHFFETQCSRQLNLRVLFRMLTVSTGSIFVVFASGNFDVTFISDVFCGEISDVIYNVRKFHFCKCHLWYKRNLLSFVYLRFIIVFDHQTVSVSATATAVSQSSVSAVVSATAVTEYSVSAHFRLQPKPEKWFRSVSTLDTVARRTSRNGLKRAVTTNLKTRMPHHFTSPPSRTNRKWLRYC